MDCPRFTGCPPNPRNYTVGCIDRLGSRLDLPAREYQYCGMAMKHASQHLGTLNTEVDTIVLDTGYGSLRNAALDRKLILAEALQLTNDTH